MESIVGQGNSSSEVYYQFLHSSPDIGLNYYRLKQIDYDGAFEYSATISVQVERETPFEIIENSTNTLNFQIRDKAVMQVYDFSGKLILQEQLSGGMHDFPLSYIASGNYIVSLTNPIFHTSILISR